jgi:hypothetical protein
MRGNRICAWAAGCLAVAACGGGGGAGAGGPGEAGAAGAFEGGAQSVDAMAADAPRGSADGSAGLHLEAGSSSGGGASTTVTSSKIDILIDMDNSASMGDKQAFLKAAIPDLINSLIDPSCVDPATNAVLGSSSNGSCVQGVLAYAPVRDMHLALITSSLGARGGDVCNPAAMAPMPFNNVSAHNDDQAHLLNRTLTYGAGGTSVIEGVVADAAPVPGDEFLYWFPGGQDAGASPGRGTPIADPTQIERDFAQLVGGAGVFGCGIESQLESWYRFLVQPDPYTSIAVSGGHAQWVGVDATILQQRRDFLRPDSIVSVIVLSDENDSEIDVRSLGGLGYNWMSASFNPPRGTTACQLTPGAAGCQSCASAGSSGDANCALGGYSALNDWGYDLNLRHVHMKQKYGVDPQFPLQRYVNGLTSVTVPDRAGEYPAGAATYQGQNDCTNPLFAASLPDGSATDAATLCALPAGTRPPGFVFYTHIGGVPASLLHYAPGNVQASALSAADWVKILGTDPLNYDYTGIDAHMIESYQPRTGVGAPGSPNGTDPVNGHDWITDTGAGHILQVDREYACTFPLVDGSGAPAPRDCTLAQNANFCDCPHAAGTLTALQLPPICDTTTFTLQTGAKAYPSIRELLLAKLLGTQGIVSSICPEHVTEQVPGDPRWGYRPAIGILVSRLTPVIKRPPQ